MLIATCYLAAALIASTTASTPAKVPFLPSQFAWRTFSTVAEGTPDAKGPVESERTLG